MLIAEPRALLKRLNPTCRQAFEVAAGLAVTGRHYEVTVEHVIVALLEDRNSDFVALLDSQGSNAEVALSEARRALTDLRHGAAGRPVFSSSLLEWVQDGLVYSLAELGETELRSGALLFSLVTATGRYMAADFQFLRSLSRDALQKALATLPGEAGSQKAGGPAGASASSAGSTGGAKAPGVAPDGALSRFTTDLTEAARSGGIDPVFGREQEIRQLIEVLVRRRKNNPIIIGEAGVGKTALVEGLARRIVEGTVPDQLKTARVLSLDLGALQAGASVRGEFENRLRSVLTEIKASPVPLILFIDEAHTLIGAGGAPGAGDAANLLKPALARGELRTIAATTYAEFKKYFEKDAALERRFQPIRVDEPSIETALVMLRGVAARFAEAHGVTIRDEAVRAAVELSSRYVSGRQLPDKAVDLLDTAAAYVKLVRAAPPAPLEDTRAALQATERELQAIERDHAAGITRDDASRHKAQSRKDELLTQEKALEDRAAEQRAIVQRIDELRSRADEAERAAARPDLERELEKLAAIPADDRLVTADVDQSVVASIVSDWTGVPLGKMMKDEMQTMLDLEARLRERVRGQDAALSILAKELRAARAGLKPASAPLGVFLLVGPSGVGKTETALSLADLVFGGERFVVTINMSEFQERHTVSRLIGSPPGYVGFGEGGVLTEAVRHRPYSVVLLDEVEKADREVMNLFYQVFDKGTLADGEGRLIDFKNTVILMTSNLATDLITNLAHPEAEPASIEQVLEAIKPTLSAYFKPALLARMTVVPYLPLRPDQIEQIARMKLQALASRVKASHEAELHITDDVIRSVAERCREVESGARNVDHILRGSVMPLVSDRILASLAEGQPVGQLELSLSSAGELVCTKGSAS